MAQYKISGVWKNQKDTITHYAFHTLNDNGHTRAVKKTKEQAIEIVESSSHTVWTWIWNYGRAEWTNGEKVTVVNGSTGKYLRSNPDNKLTDNLGHLIDFDWIAP